MQLVIVLPTHLDISVTCRALNLNGTTEDREQTSQITKLTFDYVVRDYFIIVWAFLFKQDYAFKVCDRQRETFFTPQVFCSLDQQERFAANE